ncbi:hypothetical protein M408DRAFT_333126 [Serendipita vermifera MAFF 305830]|uniref:BZIP domain-containing protein n=1 Tax=Serendipita vermifera MAFF 305830 TaxID=933852 RepID=A0A0C2WXC5_SERVB|nr:hypothetical protein M408DRAFT_333126 [Serendipita vermifera MAFF 305830]
MHEGYTTRDHDNDDHVSRHGHEQTTEPATRGSQRSRASPTHDMPMTENIDTHENDVANHEYRASSGPASTPRTSTERARSNVGPLHAAGKEYKHPSTSVVPERREGRERSLSVDEPMNGPSHDKAEYERDTDVKQKERRHERAEKEREKQRKEESRQRMLQAKKDELKRLQAEVSSAQKQYSELYETNKSLRAEVENSRNKWADAVKTLDSQRQILNASRSFTAREGTLDAATLIQSFKDLNSSIGDFSFEVLRSLDEAADTIILEQDHYNRLRDVSTDPNIMSFITAIEGCGKELTPGDVVDPVITSILVAQLINIVFRPFVPGLDEARSLALSRLYEAMRKTEPQERSARWRSITYNHTPANTGPTFLEEVADEFISQVQKVLNALIGEKQQALTPEFRQLAVSLFDAATKIQKRAKTEYVSFDYEVYGIPYNTKCDPNAMEISQAGESPPVCVWATVGLGMMATRKLHDSKEFEISYPVKATVVCDNWDHEA